MAFIRKWSQHLPSAGRRGDRSARGGDDNGTLFSFYVLLSFTCSGFEGNWFFLARLHALPSSRFVHSFHSGSCQLYFSFGIALLIYIFFFSVMSARGFAFDTRRIKGRSQGSRCSHLQGHRFFTHFPGYPSSF